MVLFITNECLFSKECEGPLLTFPEVEDIIDECVIMGL